MRTSLKLFYIIPVIIVAGICGYMFWNRSQPPPVRVPPGPPFATAPITNLTANLITAGGKLDASGNDVFIEFRDASAKLVDVGEVRFELGLNAPTAVLHSIFKVLRTSTSGQYRSTVSPQVVGDWTAKLTFSNAQSHATTSFPLEVK